MGAELCDTHIRQARAAFEKDLKEKAVLTLAIANELAVLYFGFADVVKGFASFAEFGKETFGLSQTDAYDFVRISRYFTEESARRFQITRMRAVPRLMDASGITSMQGLLQHEFKLPDGGSFRLADDPLPTTRAIEDALKALAEPAKPIPRALQRECAQKEASLVEARKKDRRLIGAGLKWEIDDGQCVLRTGKLTKDQRLAVAKYIVEVDGE